MDNLKRALEVYNSGSPLSDAHLNLLVDHFRALEKCVTVNPELAAVRLYAFINLRRLEDYLDARRDKK